jgi:hypothetical protein
VRWFHGLVRWLHGPGSGPPLGLMSMKLWMKPQLEQAREWTGAAWVKPPVGEVKRRVLMLRGSGCAGVVTGEDRHREEGAAAHDAGLVGAAALLVALVLDVAGAVLGVIEGLAQAGVVPLELGDLHGHGVAVVAITHPHDDTRKC